MKKKAHELEFISVINRDGSGTEPLMPSFLSAMLNNPLYSDGDYELHRLSLSEETFIAFNFNAYVVRLKPIER